MIAQRSLTSVGVFFLWINIVCNNLSSLKGKVCVRHKIYPTGVKIVMSSDTTFLDLLNLNLHNFEEEVKTIVDKSVKEGSMEKVLRELDRTWTAMEFEYEKHPRTEVPLVKASEELIETLEDNQVYLCILLVYTFLVHLTYFSDPFLGH